MVLALAPGADPEIVTADARRAVTAAVDGLDESRVSVVAAPAPAVRPPHDRLLVPLAAALGLVVILAAWIAVTSARQRRGMIAQ